MTAFRLRSIVFIGYKLLSKGSLTIKYACISITVLITTLVYTAQLFAWGPLGHQLVGDVAERHITDKTREALKELLSDDRTLGDVANWADSIKGERPETRPWHYANVEEGAEAFELERDCGEQSCVVEQVNLNLEVLRDPEATHAAKVEALFFLVHFVGDVHQPLHIGRASDRGGNDIEITFNRRKTNLHSLWDTGLLVHTGLGRDEYLNELLRLYGGGNKSMWQKSLDPVEWATESWKLANTHAYLVPKSGRLGSAYYGRNIKVVNERLVMAGVRLAAVLNELYDPDTGAFHKLNPDVKRVVYVIDASGSMIDSLPFCIRELKRSIAGLTEDQQFTVIVFQGGATTKLPPRGLSNNPTSEATQKRFTEWIDGIVPKGHGVPVPALEEALRYRPDVIFLLSDDGAFATDTPDKQAALLREIDSINTRGVPISTVKWMYPGNETVQGTLEMVAEHTGGQFRYIRP